MFIKAFLETSISMVEAKSDLERLRFMPQKIEGGSVVDFKGNTSFKGLDIKDVEIFDAERVNSATRCTSALTRDYFKALDVVMPLFSNGAESTTTNEVYGADIFEAVAKNDKKVLRALLKEYKTGKWSALNEDDVEDAIDDIKDCAADKDVDGAKEIVAELIGDDICEVETKSDDELDDAGACVKKPTEVKSDYKPANEDEAELLADLEDALTDEDYEDVELLLKELGNKHPRYAEFATKLPSNDSTKDEVSKDKNEDDNIITEICEDIDAALEDGDVKDAKSILEELAAEAGGDSDVYKEYEAKVNPPKERTRRKRRG